jgi:hypothetical protein
MRKYEINSTNEEEPPHTRTDFQALLSFLTCPCICLRLRSVIISATCPGSSFRLSSNTFVNQLQLMRGKKNEQRSLNRFILGFPREDLEGQVSYVFRELKLPSTDVKPLTIL